jgi:hypothetical protein
MKNKNNHKPQNTKKNVKSIPKLMVNKLAMLIGIIIPISTFIAYSMEINFFFITRIILCFVLVISIAAYLKNEIIYSHPDVVHHGNTLGNKKSVVHSKYNTKFSFSLKKGTVQVLLSIIVIIICTYIGQAIYRVMI